MNSHPLHTWSSKAIRESFFEFFKQRGHIYVPSSSTVPVDDPTLLFTNAGMNQFKNIFLGKVGPETPMGRLKRACNTQKCIRAGGKHNDLEDVGRDVYHHTFFEMLGNWSFSDYFKTEAIGFAWTLLTEVWQLPADRLYVTYFGGDNNVPADEEAREFWLQRLPSNRVLPFGNRDNFWEMGETGPCGPCTEIHFDRIGHRDASALVNMNDPDVLELWNIVFIQYNRDDSGKLKRLPAVHVDTGMGFERIVSVLQKKQSNYDTDVFCPYFDRIRELAGAPAYQNLVGEADIDKINMAYRVVADHIRTLTIAIADGGRPSNVGRGYVLRRILRRAVRFSHDKLNLQKGQLCLLVDVAVEQLRDVFPEVGQSADVVKGIVAEEESQFLKTLLKGEVHLNKVIESASNKILSGKVVWRLYDTFGFPADLTALIAQERGFSIDTASFEHERLAAQELSRREGAFKGSTSLLDIHNIDSLKNANVTTTDSSHKYKSVVEVDDSYNFPPITAIVSAVFVEGRLVEHARECECLVLLDRTNFYAEEGGQLADTGRLTSPNAELEVRDVQSYSGFVVHSCSLTGSLGVGDVLVCSVNVERRLSLMKNHTVTHALNFALRGVIGSSEQRGSLVAPDKLRFDFSSDTGLSLIQVLKVESLVNEVILTDLEIYTAELSLVQAKTIGGIRAVFGESYPDPVRVVSIGLPVQEAIGSPDSGVMFAIELCGGIHVQRSSHIEGFTILCEEGIGKGIRRVTAVTGYEAVRARLLTTEWSSKIEEFSSNHASLMGSEASTSLQGLSNLATLISSAIKEIAAIAMPYTDRCNFRQTMETLRTSILTDCRRKEAAVCQELEKLLTNIKLKSDSCFIVRSIEGPYTTKSLDAVAKGFDVPLFLVYKDAQTKRIIYYSSVPKTIANPTVSAKQWCAYVSENTDSKSGGRDTTAQGTCAESFDLPTVVQHAKEFGSRIFNMKLVN